MHLISVHLCHTTLHCHAKSCTHASLQFSETRCIDSRSHELVAGCIAENLPLKSEDPVRRECWVAGVDGKASEVALSWQPAIHTCVDA